MRRALVMLVLLWTIAAPSAALAQGGSAFSPLPPAQQATPEPTPVKSAADQSSVSRPLLLGIAGAVAILFVGIGLYIARDARRNLTETDRHALERPRELTTAERRQAERAKQKSRARAKAQRQARKKQRR
jgi:hypothetical protein